ncbi:MAG: imidazolonepropionase [Bacteroidota bacterium]|nr:imidazolonepropionase [Bacteroidota bacterium]
MASRILTNIKQLINIRKDSKPLFGHELADLPIIEGAYLIVEETEIAGFGKMADLTREHNHLPAEQLNCGGRLVLPCWCDSHTHLVFAGNRENEFVDRIRGLSYAEINSRGGGILSTVQQVHAVSEDELFNLAWRRLREVSLLGTGALEIKSGYGLSVEDELKILRVIKKLKQKSPMAIRSTFLGAHSYPMAYRENHEGYIRQIIDDMLPLIAKEKLADYIDVFCEKGFFSAPETERILKAGLVAGLKPKLHSNQLSSMGGIRTGIKLNAVSLDHLEVITEEDLQSLGTSSWKGFCTLLPTAAFFLNLPAPPARKLIDAGCALALASDYNPGSSPTGNMNLVISLGCIQMNLLPEEAVNAASLNGACAMGLGDSCGSITNGKLANLIITHPIPSLAYIPYAFGSIHIDKVMIRGEFLSQ